MFRFRLTYTKEGCDRVPSFRVAALYEIFAYSLVLPKATGLLALHDWILEVSI